MELVLIRHAQPRRVEVTDGPADPELSELGRDQARLLAEYLAEERIDRVIASPLRRALQTAQPVADVRRLTVEVADGIAEYDKESGEYIPIEQLRAEGLPGWQDVLTGNVHRAAGVDPHEFRNDVVAAVEEIVEAHPGENVAVVCHGGVINAYVSHILGIDDPSGFFYPNYTSIHRVAGARGGQRTVLSLNETAHLRSTGLRVGRFGEP
jgi:2,3-bisphosphoglycerate-dependent phosphoglycerate mutase